MGHNASPVRVTASSTLAAHRPSAGPAPSSPPSRMRWLTPAPWYQGGLNGGTSVPPAGDDALGHPGTSKAPFDLCRQNFFVFPAPVTHCCDAFKFPCRSSARPVLSERAEAKGSLSRHGDPPAMTLEPLSYEQAHKQMEVATDPRSCCCMLNGKDLQHKTKLRAAGIINTKTEAITEKTTFFSAREVSVSQPLANTAPDSACIVTPCFHRYCI